MAEEKRLARQPMLYIVQPKFKPAEVPMQTSFRTQRPSSKDSNASEPAQEVSVQEKEVRMRRQRAAHMEEISKLKSEGTAEVDQRYEEAPAESPEAAVPEKSTPRERRQRFHDLSLEEKVNYFFNLSPHVPKMKCQVTTEEAQHKGYITDYNDGIVHMKVFQRPFQQEIPFDSIKEIRLLGF